MRVAIDRTDDPIEVLCAFQRLSHDAFGIRMRTVRDFDTKIRAKILVRIL
jgi:hypothetical protein